MFRKKLLLSGRPLILFSYIRGVYSRWFDELARNWEITRKRLLHPPFTLSFWKNTYTTFLKKVGIRVALKSPLKFPHLSFNRLWRRGFASRIAHAKFVEPRWPGEFKPLPMSLRAAGSKVWAWKLKTILPVVGLAILAYWSGSLIREFSVPPPTLVRLPMPPAVANPGPDLLGWVDVPRPLIVIRPEVVPEPTPVPGPPQPAVKPTPSIPKLSVTQIFARLDRGEITLAQTKDLLAAKGSVSNWGSSGNYWSEE